MIRCEKCGREMDRILTSRFDHNGSDSVCGHPVQECDENAVYFDTDSAWVGYELSEDEQRDTIMCPNCGEFPFRETEVQVHDVVRVVCFKQGKEE